MEAIRLLLGGSQNECSLSVARSITAMFGRSRRFIVSRTKRVRSLVSVQGGNVEVVTGAATGQSLLYMPQSEIPFEDLDDIELCEAPQPRFCSLVDC